MTDRVQGVVVEIRPQGLYSVKSEDGRELLVSLSVVGRKVAANLVVGARVVIKVSPLDPTRGRIQGRF